MTSKKSLPTNAALINARKKIGWGIFRRILLQLYRLYEQHHAGKHLWRGRRVYAIDGSKINLPRLLASKKYRLPGIKSFYPQGLASVLYDVVARLPVTAILSRHTNERQAAKELLQALRPENIVLYDRGYLSGELLKWHSRLGIDAIFRVQHQSFKELNLFCNSKEREAIIQIQRPGLDVHLRVVRFKVKGSEIVLATTLVNKIQFPTKALTKLYHERWNIEESYKTFKRTLDLEQWHSKNVVGVRQEFFAKLIALFFTRLIELSARKIKRKKNERSKPSERVGIKAVKEVFLTTENERGVSLSKVQFLHKVTGRHRTQTKLGRSFERRSRKPIGKFRMERKKRAKLAKAQTGTVKAQIPP